MQPETFMPLPGPQPERRGKILGFLAHFGLGDCTWGLGWEPKHAQFYVRGHACATKIKSAQMELKLKSYYEMLLC